MSRSLIVSSFALVLFVGALLAFDVPIVIKSVDAEKGVIRFSAGEKERSAAVDKDAKLLDDQGKELAGGLKAAALKEGTAATLSLEAIDGKPVIRSLRLGKAPAAPPAGVEAPRVDTSKLVPLTDLGRGEYRGFPGGLYPGGANERPSAYETAGLALAKQIQPLDAAGRPDPQGKIVLLGIGFSNTVQSFMGFMQVAALEKDLNSNLVLVNGAVGGRSANMIQYTDKGKGSEYWTAVDEKLKAAGVTRAQVQAVWIKETNPGPHEGGFPKYIQTLHDELARIVQILPGRFPNLKLAFLSSRTYAGWAKATPGRQAPGNSEPYSYETAFAVKWLIEGQLKGEAGLNYDATKGPVRAPWMSWGPYLWANGEVKRKDGYSFKPTDFTDRDRMHHSQDGMEKIGKELLRFFKTDATTRTWFVKQAGP